MTNIDATPQNSTNQTFLGLAPYLRQNLAGIDLLPTGQIMLSQLANQQDNADLWMNLSTLMYCIGQNDLAASMQAQALEIQRVFTLSAKQQPAKLRLLLFMLPGDLATNTPIDCLLENTEIELIYYFLDLDQPSLLPVPEHDIAMIAISEDDQTLGLLAKLASALVNWPKPVINAAEYIPIVGRCRAAQSLHDINGLLMPLVHRISRTILTKVQKKQLALKQILVDCHFPIIIRPVGSHAGRDLEKLVDLQALANYLSKCPNSEFFVSQFIDYRSADQQFRKLRIVLIAGEPYICHFAISDHWLIHYVNAGMYQDQQKRDEEAEFMNNFSEFIHRHQAALTAIYQRTRLEYLGIDCAETLSGELLVFEIDHAMVVHAMEPAAQFPYKQAHIQKLQQAFIALLLRKAGLDL